MPILSGFLIGLIKTKETPTSVVKSGGIGECLIKGRRSTTFETSWKGEPLKAL